MIYWEDSDNFLAICLKTYLNPSTFLTNILLLQFITSAIYILFVSWIVSSNHQWMAVGATGRHGNHAAWRVEWDTGHDFAHALIQRQNGIEWIAVGQTSWHRDAICPSAKVEASFFESFLLKMIPPFYYVLVCFLRVLNSGAELVFDL